MGTAHPSGRARLFLAAWPPADVAVRLASHARDEPGGRWMSADRLHVTLRFFGMAIPDDVVAALAGVRIERATAHVDGRATRLGRDALVVDVSGLDGLAHTVRTATASIGRPAEGRFRGHITLARVRDRPGLEVGPMAPMTFDVDEVTLVRSVTSHLGAVYEVLERWSCAG